MITVRPIISQYCVPSFFSHIKKYLLAEIIYFLLLSHLLTCPAISRYNFLFENHFNLGNRIFVMYTDIPEFHLISPIALMMNDLHLSSYMTKKGSDDVGLKYFLPKKTWQVERS